MAESMGLELTANEAFVKDLRKVLITSPHILLRLSKVINTDRGYSTANHEEILQIWTDAGLPTEDLTDVYSVLKYLFDQGLEKKVPPHALVEEVIAFCVDRGIEGAEERRDILMALLTPSEQYEHRRRIIPFATSVVPMLSSISSVIDVRAAFSDKNSTEILGYIPVVQVRLMLEDDVTDDKQAVIFQMTERAFELLVEKLRGIERQLAAVKASLSPEIMLLRLDEKDGDDAK